DLAFAERRGDDVGAAPADLLAYRDVMVGVRGDLLEMRDHHDLMVTGERPERAADGLADAAADAGIDLVEHEHRRPVARGEGDLEREHDPRELATRRDLVDRLGRLPGIRRDEEAHVVAARRVRRALREPHAEAAALEREIHKVRLDRGGQRRRGLAARVVQRFRRLRERGARLRLLLVELREPRLALTERLELRRGALAVRDDRGHVVPVLAAEVVQEIGARLEIRATLRIGLDALRVATQVGRDLVRLRKGRGHALERGREPRIQAGGASQLPFGEGEPIARARAVAGEQLLRGAGRFPQPLRRSRDRELRIEPRLLVRTEPRRADLLDLVPEQLRAPLPLARIAAQRRALALERDERGVRARGALAQRVVAAERVEHVALDLRTRETELISLTVDRDEVGADLRERGDRHGLLVDAR